MITQILLTVCIEGAATVLLLLIVSVQLYKLNRHLSNLRIEEVNDVRPTDWVSGDVHFAEAVPPIQRPPVQRRERH